MYLNGVGALDSKSTLTSYWLQVYGQWLLPSLTN